MDLCDHVFTKREMEFFDGDVCKQVVFLYGLKVDILHSPCPPPHVPKLQDKDVPQLGDMQKDSDFEFNFVHMDSWSSFIRFFEDLYKIAMEDIRNYLIKTRIGDRISYGRNKAANTIYKTVLLSFSRMAGEKKKWMYEITNTYIEFILTYLEDKHVFQNPKSTFYWNTLPEPEMFIIHFIHTHMSSYTDMNFCYLGGPKYRPNCISVREMHKKIQLVMQGNKRKCSLFGKLSIELVYKILDSMNIQSLSGTKWSSFSSGKYAITI